MDVVSLVVTNEAPLPPLTGTRFVTTWALDSLVITLLIAAAALYLYGVGRVARAHPTSPWPPSRTGSFLAGLVVIAVATMSSVGAYDDVLFWVHMVQHLLLIMVAPALLVAGRPATLLLHTSGNPTHTLAKRALRSRVATAVTFPPLVALAYAATIAVTHLTGLANLTLEHPLLHEGEHVLYLMVGYLYFLLLFGDEPIRWRLSFGDRMALLGVGMLADTVTGLVLLTTRAELFPAYAAAHQDWGPGLVADLHIGGAVMLIGGNAIMLVHLLFVVRHRPAARNQKAAGGLDRLQRARMRPSTTGRQA